jgi:hypothetical protein
MGTQEASRHGRMSGTANERYSDRSGTSSRRKIVPCDQAIHSPICGRSLRPQMQVPLSCLSGCAKIALAPNYA